MKNKRYMPANGIERLSTPAIISRAVNYGVIPNEIDVVTTWLTFMDDRYAGNYAKDILVNTPSMFDPLPGFTPMFKDSKEYLEFEDQKKIDNVTNKYNAAGIMMELAAKNKQK